MEFNIKGVFKTSILMAALTGAAFPVSAALVYEWVSTSGVEATGLIKLDAAIGVGDTFDPLTEITAFEFKVSGTDYGLDAFYDSNGTWDVDTLGLCAPSCSTDATDATDSTGKKKVAKKKATKKKATKKKVRKKGAPADIEFFYTTNEVTAGVFDNYWSFTAYDGVSSFTSDGNWVSISNVPAPGALILFLSGIGVLGVFKRKLTKNVN